MHLEWIEDRTKSPTNKEMEMILLLLSQRVLETRAPDVLNEIVSKLNLPYAWHEVAYPLESLFFKALGDQRSFLSWMKDADSNPVEYSIYLYDLFCWVRGYYA